MNTFHVTTIRTALYIGMTAVAIAGHALAAPFDQTIEFPEAGDVTSDKVDAPPLIGADEGVVELTEAQRAFKAGDLKLCQEKLRLAYANNPHMAPPKLLLANLYVANGQVGVGRRLLEEVAIAHPTRPEVYLLFGRLALYDGHVTDAALNFEKALALPMPSNWKDEQREYVQRTCLEGRTAIAQRRRDWKGAAELLQQQVEADPKNTALRDRYAMTLFRGGELDRAFEQFDVAHLQDNKMNPPEVSMAVMHVQKGEYDKADKWFAKALASHGEDGQVHFERSIALLYADRTEEADKHAAKAAELGLDAPLLSIHRGHIAVQKGDWAEAEKFFRTALKDSPDNPATMAKLALALVEQNDAAKKQEAVKLADAAAEQGNNTVEAVAALGWVYYRTGDKEKAAPLLEAAGKHPAADPTALFFYARWLVEAKESEKAQQVAQLLSERIEEPGLFALRPGVRKWLPTVLDK